MGQEIDVARTAIKDKKVQAAFRLVSANCELDPRGLRRLRSDPRVSGKICTLARTSPEYQRHVVERLLAGDRNPLRPIAATLNTYDTVRFGEVTSRLHRALGCVRKEAELVARNIRAGEAINRLSDRLLTLDLVTEHSTTLLGMLANLPVVQREAKRKKGRANARSELADRLYAPGALGLVAKNVRNVSDLQAAHFPAQHELQLALALTRDIQRIASAARDEARRAFGPVDDDRRVRPPTTPKRRIITHDKPDGDAIVAAWLAERFLFTGEAVELLFVPRARVLGAYRDGDCLVDVGNTFDPASRFFDHKPPALPHRGDSCAAMLVWEELLQRGHCVKHLQSLMEARRTAPPTFTTQQIVLPPRRLPRSSAKRFPITDRSTVSALAETEAVARAGMASAVVGHLLK